MNPSVLLFAGAAVGTLVLGFQVFRLTSSPGIRLVTCLGTVALAYGAFGLDKPGGPKNAAQIAFVVAMLFAGRALGILWKSRRDSELRLPSHMLFAMAGISMAAAITAYLS